MPSGSFVSYLRVSTAQQGRSGLGLEAQREAVRAYLNGGAWTLLEEYQEVETGKNDDRPALAKALHHCRLTGATLVIAKLDRLSRDAHFLLGLQKGSIPFVAVDMPQANDLTVGIMALVAQEERKAISSRTKAALAAAKARGVSLGGWKGGPVVDSRKGTAALQKRADAFVANVGPMVASLRNEGLSLRQIATVLAEKGVRTARAGDWTAAAVRAVLLRRERLEVPG